ncbi:transcription-repair coupling factor [Chlamydiales bacterium]|nr:transcription-repair coupling factor [Chlamydiales bacterium]
MLPFNKGKSYLFEKLWNAPKAKLLAKALEETKKHLLILDGNELFHDLSYFTKAEIIDFPAWENLPTEEIAPSPDVVGDRYQALKKIEDSKEPCIILSSLQGCLQKVLPQKAFNKLYQTLKVGESHPFEPLIQKLTEMGYQKTSTTSDKGEFSVRGGLIDLYPVSSPDPFRIEFFDDEIESIRVFDPIGQKSIRHVDQISLTAGLEMELVNQADSLSTLLEYLGKNTIIVFNDLIDTEDKWAQLKTILGRPTKTFTSMDEWFNQITLYQTLYFSKERLDSMEMFSRPLNATRTHLPFLPIEDLDDIDPKSHITFLTTSDKEKLMLQEKILPYAFPHTEWKTGYLTEGFIYEDTVFYPYTELSHKHKIRRQKQRSTYHTTPFTYYELTANDLVVHINHGIGKYLGMEKRNDQEFISIEYAEGGKLLVPLNQAHLVSKYIGSHDEFPKLHTIGSSRWKTMKEKTERAIAGYATELLDLYAKRELKGGYAYPPNDEDMIAFEEEFPFIETEDQKRAIDDLIKDMEQKKPMDRLICGDVGYGKTEVAMRAAFKAAEAGKQVAILVPTTILAMQHYETFVERMGNFPITIAPLSRFLTAKKNKETLRGIEQGSVDIVIGTHRLISQEITFKNLGLVIIDEEQRFGVKAKEHLKKAKTGVDCLTLSATPIPRTLYMSIIGVRDVSIINTPPQDRLPIKSMITEPTDDILYTALLREISRGGQSYVIHNRVETIFGFAAKLQKLLPQAKIIVGHGQMSSKEIDHVFHTFKKGDADILVATTIVESGIDIPNANTILIDRADRFGMADLYQLRGRVGRWNRRAFCYFLVKNIRRLPEIAKKRLYALTETSGYGGGMKVAMRDLEIRGAGDILGMEQSGHVSHIGFQLYCKLLEKTIKALKGELPKNLTDCQVQIPFDAKFPEYYIPEVSLRMELYRRLGESLSLLEVEEIFLEVTDRFGKLPEEAKWLKALSEIRVQGSLHKCTLIKLEKHSLIIERKKGDGIVKLKKILKFENDPQNFKEKIFQAI